MKYGEITLDEPEEDKDRKIGVAAVATALGFLEDAATRKAPVDLYMENIFRLLSSR
jgi:hypothetical protein